MWSIFSIGRFFLPGLKNAVITRMLLHPLSEPHVRKTCTHYAVLMYASTFGLPFLAEDANSAPGIDPEMAYVQSMNTHHLFDQESELERILELQYGKVNTILSQFSWQGRCTVPFTSRLHAARPDGSIVSLQFPIKSDCLSVCVCVSVHCCCASTKPCGYQGDWNKDGRVFSSWLCDCNFVASL